MNNYLNAKVGIITRTKDRPVLLRRAIESVLGQSYQDWVMIIVNDGGQQEHVENLVEHYRDQAGGRIHVIHNQFSLGMEAASNVGIRSVKSDYLVIHDDDDSWSPEFLTIAVHELDISTLKYPRVKGVITYCNRVLERVIGNVVMIDQVDPFNTWIPAGVLNFERIFAGNTFPPICFLYQTEALDVIGPYREDLPVLGDWEFNIRFLTKWDIVVIPQVLAFYHHRIGDQFGSYGNTVIAAFERHRFYEQLLKNEWLRTDLAAGSASIGVLANWSPYLEQLVGQVYEITQLRQDLLNLFNRLDAVEKRLATGPEPDSLTKALNAVSTIRVNLPLLKTTFSSWLKSGHRFHYVFAFFKTLITKGPRHAVNMVKLWAVKFFE